uniref:Uncharacterized protein n=1 Tax=Rhizophagus irregularis (strain DAOM 181602 / DAOM 197198 / MUCL 43194) TaxID=747089 RepID=U9UEC1_RHIID
MKPLPNIRYRTNRSRILKLHFFSDGSLTKDLDQNMSQMGFGRILSSLTDINLSHNGSLEHWKHKKNSQKPLNYIRFEHHLSHKSLKIIKDFNLNNVIDWKYTQIWMLYNQFDRPTSLKLSKFNSWKMKTSSNNLPTFDILNLNFPDNETNEYLQSCGEVIKLLIPIFRKLGHCYVPNADHPEAVFKESFSRCEHFN